MADRKLSKQTVANVVALIKSIDLMFEDKDVDYKKMTIIVSKDNGFTAQRMIVEGENKDVFLDYTGVNDTCLRLGVKGDLI